MTKCAYCSKPAHGNYSIHRDGFGVGPQVALCDDCGGHLFPTCDAIWERISRRRKRPPATKARGRSAASR